MSTKPALKPGLFFGLSFDAYAAIPAVNHSTLKHCSRSMAHVREYVTAQSESTEAQEFGSAYHAAALEPADFEKNYVAAPACDRRTKAGKETWTEFQIANAGKSVLTADEYADASGMCAALLRDPLARSLLCGNQGRNEVVAVWQDARTGLWCKARLDRWTAWLDWECVIDLKSTDDARPDAFARHVHKFHYHTQAAFYLQGLAALEAGNRRHFIIAQEKSRPYGVKVHELDDEAIAQGKHEVRKWLDAYAACTASGLWPGYDNEAPEPLSLPKWALAGVGHVTE